MNENGFAIIIRKWRRKESSTTTFFFFLALVRIVIRIILLIKSSGETLNEEIDIEATKYDDLVIGDFVDTYENLPLKTFLGFQFFAGFCYGNKVYSFAFKIFFNFYF